MTQVAIFLSGIIAGQLLIVYVIVFAIRERTARRID